jgi:tRNA(Ile)-lysidine synthase
VTLRITTSVRQSVRGALRPHRRVVLAISGGLDSMVLLDAAAQVAAADTLLVATYDHGTGVASTAAAALVSERACALGLSVVSARAGMRLTSEAEWRDARWSFLRSSAAENCGVVFTAHTRDDQVETVLMRVMRGAGARGLAGLLADSDVVRPLLKFSRRELVSYARAEGLTWIEDPSNDSPRHFRNRIRHDLLPAMRRVHHSIDEDLLAIGKRAAGWRAKVEALVGELAPESIDTVAGRHGIDVRAASLAGYSAKSLGVLWPVLAARVGLTLNRRGTERLSAFTRAGRVGSRVQLSGGWEVFRSRSDFELRRNVPAPPACALIEDSGVLDWAGWTFRRVETALPGDLWRAWLPGDRPLVVRAWQAGDVMSMRQGASGRKVKRLLSDAGVTGARRAGWPVVLAGKQIVWIPGVRRSDAVTERSGRPALPFLCEYIDR